MRDGEFLGPVERFATIRRRRKALASWGEGASGVASICGCIYAIVCTVRSNGDEAKNRQNRRKHGVDFEVAALVFEDTNHRSEQDRVVNGEERWQTIGWVKELLLVCHTWTQEDVVRIVSARKASRKERNRY